MTLHALIPCFPQATQPVGLPSTDHTSPEEQAQALTLPRASTLLMLILAPIIRRCQDCPVLQKGRDTGRLSGGRRSQTLAPASRHLLGFRGSWKPQHTGSSLRTRSPVAAYTTQPQARGVLQPGYTTPPPSQTSRSRSEPGAPTWGRGHPGWAGAAECWEVFLGCGTREGPQGPREPRGFLGDAPN